MSLPEPAPPIGREQLVPAARALPRSALRAVILATLAEREPTARELAAWSDALETQLKESSHAGHSR